MAYISDGTGEGEVVPTDEHVPVLAMAYISYGLYWSWPISVMAPGEGEVVPTDEHAPACTLRKKRPRPRSAAAPSMRRDAPFQILLKKTRRGALAPGSGGPVDGLWSGARRARVGLGPRSR